MRPMILVVEDDDATRKMIHVALQDNGFAVISAGTAQEAMHAIREQSPDLVLLDLILPDADGVEVCRCVREFSDVNIIMVTAKRDLTDRLAGLDAGADDYVAKPLAMGELVARVKSQLRRRRMREEAEAEIIRCGDLQLDRSRLVVRVRGADVDMTEVEMGILSALAGAEDHLLSSAQICDAVWGKDAGDPIVLDAHIANIRRKIEHAPDHPEILLTVPGVGYRLG